MEPERGKKKRLGSAKADDKVGLKKRSILRLDKNKKPKGKKIKNLDLLDVIILKSMRVGEVAWVRKGFTEGSTNLKEADGTLV